MQAPFTKKLELILENQENSQIISWAKRKTIIEIRDEENFQKMILPKYFRHGKMASFIRQLNLYGFRKIRSVSKQSYTHPNLEIGKPIKEILCVKKLEVLKQKNEAIESQRGVQEQANVELQNIENKKEVRIPQNQIKNENIMFNNSMNIWYPTEQQNNYMAMMPGQYNSWRMPQNSFQYPTTCTLPNGFFIF